MKLLPSSLALLALVAATSYAVAGETSYDVCVNLARDVRVSGSTKRRSDRKHTGDDPVRRI